MCLWNKLGLNPKYKENKKNRGVIPPISDYRTLYTPWGCGVCIECKKKKAREWQIRLLEDIKTNINGRFITLTLSNESYAELDQLIDKVPYKPKEGYERDNEIATVAVRRFLERWRKKYKKSVRHWLVTELGHKGTENIHIHGIIWTGENSKKWEAIKEIRDIWKYGFIYPRNEYEARNNYVNNSTIGYMVKYIHKIDKEHKTYKQIILNSAGIGRNYIPYKEVAIWDGARIRIIKENIEVGDWVRNKYKKEGTVETYKSRTGHEMILPTYYRNIIYKEEEKEKLWIEKLNKEERWVCGEKVDISKGEKQYEKTVEYHRKRSKKLGYTDGGKNWKREEYEKQRRIIAQLTRIAKGRT